MFHVKHETKRKKGLMILSRKTATRGIELIKEFEGCRLTAYKCPAGVWTIGFGHTGTVDGKKIGSGMTITAAKATELLRGDLAKFEAAVNSYVTAPITQNMFDALVSFAYNCGAGALKGSTLLRKLNAKDYDEAAAEFPKWNKAGGKVLNGLVRRRERERQLFLYNADEVTKTSPDGFRVGDSVVLNGYLYVDSYASIKGKHCTNRRATITKIAESVNLRKAPYLLDNGLGWARAEDIKK